MHRATRACPNGHDAVHSPDDRFCTLCGAPMMGVCDRGHLVPSESPICPVCAAPSLKPHPRDHRNLLHAAGYVVLCVAVGAAAFVVTNRLSHRATTSPRSPNQTSTVGSSPPSHPTTSTTSPAVSAVSKIWEIVQAAQNTLQSEVLPAQLELQNCEANSAYQNLSSAIQSYNGDLGVATTIRASAIPQYGSALLNDLKKSLHASRTADQDRERWAEEEMTSCTPPMTDPMIGTLNDDDKLSTSYKDKFERIWNCYIAPPYHKPTLSGNPPF